VLEPAVVADGTRPADEFRLAGHMIGDSRPGSRGSGPRAGPASMPRVPDFVRRGDAGQIGAFLSACLGGAARVSHRGGERQDIVIEFAGASRGLLEDTQHLLLRLG